VTVIEIHPPGCRSLNFREVVNHLFFPWDPVKHVDSKRQRSRRQRTCSYQLARRLKRQYVPLYNVDPTVYLRRWGWDGYRYEAVDVRTHREVW
jgi:hypothetical protein